MMMKYLFKEVKEKLALLETVRTDVRELMNELLKDEQLKVYHKLKEIDKKLKEIL